VYNRKIIEDNIRRAAEVIARRHSLPARWDLRYPTPAERSEMRAHLDSLLDPNDRPTRKLTREEELWVLCETTLCKLDYQYYSRNYAMVEDEEARIVAFAPRRPQRIVDRIYERNELDSVAQMLINLKARQLGRSLHAQIRLSHRVFFYRNVKCMTGSSEPDKSKEMLAKLEFIHTHLPWWMKPRITDYRAGERIRFGELNSVIFVSWGNQKKGIGRGMTPTIAHLCFSPQTLVRVMDGQVIPITEVKPGDEVLGGNGKLTSVKAIWKSPRRNELTSDLWLWGMFAPLSTTRDHEIMTPNGLVQARNLRAGDYVSYPIRPITHSISQFTIQHGKNAPRKEDGRKVEDFPLNYDWGWLLGLYLAEGSIQLSHKPQGIYPTGVVFSLDMGEVDKFSARLEGAIGKKSFVCGKRETSRTRTVNFSNAALARWVNENFGRKDGKHVPDWVFEAGKDFCKGLIEGYLEGDGHIKPDSNEIFATSTRLGILISIRELCASLGYGWSSLYFKEAGRYYGRDCQNAWIWTMSGEGAAKLRESAGWPVYPNNENLHFRLREGYVDIEVSRNLDGYSTDFYDLEVDASHHTFTTLQCGVSNSELGEFEDAAKLVDASLIRALHENPFTIFELEGTAERMGDWWNRTWDFNVKMDGRGLARFKPLFLPWFVGTDIYPKPAWLRRRPVPRDWEIPEYIERHAEAAAAYVAATPIIREELGEGWRMPIEQKWFYHLEYEEAREKRQLHHFLKEMPANPQQAWQNANPSVLDIETLVEVQTRAAASTPVGVYQLAGVNVPRTYNEYRRDPNQRSHELLCKSTSGKLQETFTLEPLRLEAWPDLDPMGKIYIWEWPQAGETYGIGCDPSEGVDQDRSSIPVIKKATPWHPDEQVAEFASPRVFADDLWLWMFALCHLYTVSRPSGGWTYAKAVIEVNIAAGDKVQTEMLKRGWPNFHQRYDPTKIGTTGTGAMMRARSLAEEIGWRTTRANRPNIISGIRKYVRDGQFIVRSPWLAQELATLEYNLDKKRIEASEGNYDDRPMSAGIVLASWYDPEVYGSEPQAWREARELERKIMEDPRLAVGPVGTAAPRAGRVGTEEVRDSRGIYG
jgi:hypothetical protein